MMASHHTLNPAPQPEPLAPPEQRWANFPFESESFHRHWWQHLACRFNIPVKGQDLLIHKKSMAKGLIQLREARISGWNNAWNQILTAARMLELEELSRTSHWDYFRLVWTENDRCPALLEQLQTNGFLILEKPAPCQYSIDLSAGLDGYLQGLSHNSRKSLKKKTRKGQVLNPVLESCRNADEIDAFFETLFSHHIRYWNEKAGSSYFNIPAERQFIVHWAKALHQEGKLVLERLIMGGEVVNMIVGIQTETEFYWLLTINTGIHLDYAPGIISLYLRLEQLAAQGVTRFHMGTGDYFYKVQSANRITQCQELIVANPHSLKGKLYFHWL